MTARVGRTEDPAPQLARQPRIRVLGVKYAHLGLDDGDDLYITTEYGLGFWEQLLPKNYWTDEDWFSAHNVKLPGTSALYKIRTKEVAGLAKDIVLKWNRMGQDIPGATEASDLAGAKFNSPFEEFSLLVELRNARHESPGRLYTHKPLAIYVPKDYVEPERLGRKQYRIDAIQKNHEEVNLDINRQYAVIYEWIKGMDAAEAIEAGLLDQETLTHLMASSAEAMHRKGFLVRDNKAHHHIVRSTRKGSLARSKDGDILYALVDFELLERTPQREQAVRASKRKAYLVKQAHRFEAKADFPPGLTPVTIMGVDYVYGRTEVTGGALWVVGKDPALFDYFLPEKWRKTPRTKLSVASPIYDTTTKDNIHLVWRVSRAGARPDMDPFRPDEKKILTYGYNSPFEEISLSMELTNHGIETTYPRAIYMTGHKSETSAALLDGSRYQSHQALGTPDGHPLFSENHDYMIIWGYWNGPDELLAAKDEDYYRGMNALSAYREGLISEQMYMRLMAETRRKLADVGIEDLNLRGNHLLLSLDKSGRLLMGDQGIPAVRICNFELLRRIES